MATSRELKKQARERAAQIRRAAGRNPKKKRKAPSKETQIKMIRGALKSPKTPKVFLPSLKKRLAKLLAAIAILATLGAVSARAQFIGTVNLQTVQQTLATTTACTGGAQTFLVANLGQTQHSATTVGTGLVQFQAEIDGIDVQGNVYRISDVQKTPGTSSVLFGSGYFPKVQISITCSPLTATFTLSYSGSASPNSSTIGTYLSGQIDKVLFAGAAANINASNSGWQPPYENSYGNLIFQYNVAGPAGSFVTVQCTANTGSGAVFQQVFSIPGGGNTVLQFPVAAASCPAMAVSYTSGGATAATYKLEYVFVQPGLPVATASAQGFLTANSSAATIAEKGGRWSVASTPAAGAQATATKAAGVQGVFHVADCVSYSLSAIAAPAATQLTLNLRDGVSGMGTILWTKTLAVPATAAPHYNFDFCGLNLMNAVNAAAMTLEFAAGLANEFESVTLTGYDLQ